MNQTLDNVLSGSTMNIASQMSGAMIPYAATPDPAVVQPLLDKTSTLVFAYRNASTDGETLTAEISGDSGARKMA